MSAKFAIPSRSACLAQRWGLLARRQHPPAATERPSLSPRLSLPHLRQAYRRPGVHPVRATGGKPFAGDSSLGVLRLKAVVPGAFTGCPMLAPPAAVDIGEPCMSG